MQSFHQNSSRALSNQTTRFLTRSFCFSLLYATGLYLLVRIFFYEFPFTVSEGFELHGKILVVVWIFLITGKLFVAGIILLENNISRISAYPIAYTRILKTTIIIFVASVLAFTGKGATTNNAVNADASDESNY